MRAPKPRARPGSGGVRRLALVITAAIAAVLTLTIVLLPHGLTAPRTGTPSAAARIALNPGPSLTVTRVPAVGQTDRMSVQEQMVAAVLTDLEDYWGRVIPERFDLPADRLAGGVTAIDSAISSASAPCVTRADLAVGNAFYCASNDGIVFDSAVLIPVVLARYGPAGLATTFAHEYGHAIQARIGPTATDRAEAPQLYPSLAVEAQGDCYAGAFLSWVAAGGSQFLALDADAMLPALGPLIDFADPATVSPVSSTAHGMTMDRWLWFHTGFTSGAAPCHEMTMDSIDPLLGRGTDGAPSNQERFDAPRFADPAGLQHAVIDSLTDFDVDLTLPPADDTTAAATAAVDVYGQYAAATVLVFEAARDAAGARAPADAACVTGAWVKHTFDPGPGDTLGSWPSDADEALFAMVRRPGATYTEVLAFTDGFRDGAAACTTER